MKIKLKDLKANPFKKYINNGKLNYQKIESLKESIKQDGFWDNVICRKKDNDYEIAYGHHRLEAAKQILGDNYEIDIPVKELTDEMMIRVMGNENCMQNEEYAVYQIDQVLLTKKWMEDSGWLRNTQPRPGKESGIISSEDISTFLGRKNWSPEKIAQYLRIHEKLHPKLLHQMKNAPNIGGDKSGGELTVSHARAIARLPEAEQLEIAKIVKDQKLDSRATEEVVNRLLGKDTKINHQRKINLEKVGKVIANLEGREILLRCGDLIRLFRKHNIDEFEPKEETVLRDWISKLNQAANTFLGEKE